MIVRPFTVDVLNQSMKLIRCEFVIICAGKKIKVTTGCVCDSKWKSVTCGIIAFLSVYMLCELHSFRGFFEYDVYSTFISSKKNI